MLLAVNFDSLHFFKLTIGERKQSVNSFRILLNLSLKLSLLAIVILLQYPLDMFVVLLFSYLRR